MAAHCVHTHCHGGPSLGCMIFCVYVHPCECAVHISHMCLCLFTQGHEEGALGWLYRCSPQSLAAGCSLQMARGCVGCSLVRAVTHRFQ